MTTHDELRRLAGAATPGPWTSTYDEADQWFSITGAGYSLGGGLWMICPAVATVENGGQSDAEFSAAVDPQTILGLLDEIDRLRLSQDYTPEGVDMVMQQIHDARAERDALIERAEKAERKRDELAAALERVRDALTNYPRACNEHPDDDVVKCGWKQAVLDIQSALDGEESC